MFLYHATLAKNAASIKKNGLRVSNGRRKSYDGSYTKGLLFLADNPDIARNFAEVAQMEWDNAEADEPVVVFRVDDKKLIKKDLSPDRNIIFDPDEEIYAFEYPHNIPAELLETYEDG